VSEQIKSRTVNTEAGRNANSGHPGFDGDAGDQPLKNPRRTPGRYILIALACSASALASVRPHLPRTSVETSSLIGQDKQEFIAQPTDDVMNDPRPNASHLPPPIPPLGNPPPPIPSSSGSVLLRFFIGLLIGIAGSVVVWIVGWERFVDKGSGLAILIVPGLKLVAGMTFIFIPRWRSFGAGILVSIALGFLIFGGMLFTNLFDVPKSSASTTSPTTQSVTCKWMP
jgi:hypothetical protein